MNDVTTLQLLLDDPEVFFRLFLAFHSSVTEPYLTLRRLEISTIRVTASQRRFIIVINLRLIVPDPNTLSPPPSSTLLSSSLTALSYGPHELSN